MYKRYIKRILDFLCSLFALIILFPLLIIISIIIKLDSKGPIFFLQERLGKDGKVFKIIKFRTMIVNAEHIGEGLRVSSENDNRITKIGKILRKTSLDELPQLINILKGDMSLVGPRPPVTYHPYKYEKYSDEQKKRFCVRPGITGLAQVKGRGSIDWKERIKVDCIYIQKISFFLDIQILLKTVFVVSKKEDIYIRKTEINYKEEEII